MNSLKRSITLHEGTAIKGTVPSRSAVASDRLSGLNSTAFTVACGSSQTARCGWVPPVPQRMTSPRAPAAARSLPSGLNSRSSIVPRVAIELSGAWLAASHSVMSPSCSRQGPAVGAERHGTHPVVDRQRPGVALRLLAEQAAAALDGRRDPKCLHAEQHRQIGARRVQHPGATESGVRTKTNARVASMPRWMRSRQSEAGGMSSRSIHTCFSRASSETTILNANGSSARARTRTRQGDPDAAYPLRPEAWSR
jgi:hypothetical protein